LATVLLTLASLVKIYAVVALALHLVLVMRERGWGRAWRHAGLAGGISAIAFAPFWAGLKTFSGVWEARKLANLSLTGMVQRVLGVSLRQFISRHLAWLIAQSAVRVVAGGVLVGIAIWAVRRVRDERSFWWATLVMLTAYLYLTPWFMYWYPIAALALVAVLPINPLTYPLVTFSASSLVAVWFRPQMAGQVTQTLLRYVPPVAVHVGLRRKPVTVRRLGGGRVSISIPPASAAAATAGAPATE
jgi:hypothetical protein